VRYLPGTDTSRRDAQGPAGHCSWLRVDEAWPSVDPLTNLRLTLNPSSPHARRIRMNHTDVHEVFNARRQRPFVQCVSSRVPSNTTRPTLGRGLSHSACSTPAETYECRWGTALVQLRQFPSHHLEFPPHRTRQRCSRAT
jgi:hypothetical protein